jgi:hypothetical protein
MHLLQKSSGEIYDAVVLTEALNNPKELVAIKAFSERRDAARCTPVDDSQQKLK